jgi:uncharacterized integral membrane protein
MKVVRILIVAMLLVLVLFAAINWAVFMVPTRLTVAFTEFDAPLGAILLGVALGMSVLFLIYAASLRTSTLLELRRLSRELDEQRALADQAEASRFTELRGLVEQGLQGLDARLEGATETIVARADSVEQNLRAGVEDATNSLSSFIGQMDEKLERRLQDSSTS